jgi:hypothetical protein
MASVAIVDSYVLNDKGSPGIKLRECKQDITPGGIGLREIDPIAGAPGALPLGTWDGYAFR